MKIEFNFESVERRLLKHYRPAPSGCWEWIGGRDPYGYGKIKIKGHNLGAHRIAMAVWRGFELGSALKVLHRCDNPRCINPDHLFLGTQSDNLNDCVRKGRHRFTLPFRGSGYVRPAVTMLTKQRMRQSRLKWLKEHPGYSKWFSRVGHVACGHKVQNLP